MKRAIISSCIICFTGVLQGQDAHEFVLKDPRAVYIPLHHTYSTAFISSYINSAFKTEREKLLAIYSWVTTNIRYDTDSMYAINSERDPEARVTEALRRRKGVCENYAALFTDIAVKCGIKCYIVSGYTKQLGAIDRSGHSWCAVSLENEWYLCDPTWDEGNSMNARWYLLPPGRFIDTHMPFDPLWQLLEYRITHKEFVSGRTYARKQKDLINYNSEVNAYLLLTRLQQLESAISRIRESGTENELVKNRLKFLQMQAGIIYEERDMNLYNTAVSDFNKANEILNEFIQYRNNRFLPVKEETFFSEMLKKSTTYILSANNKLSILSRSETNDQYDPSILLNRLSTLSSKLAEQQLFLGRYFSANIPEREKLFYK